MNKKVLSLSTLALTGVLFVGCSETPLNETYVEDAGDLLVYARDAGTGGVLTTAKVTLLSADKTPREVDVTGNVTYKNLPVGQNYTVRVEAENYAPLLCQASITAQIADNILNAQNFVLRANLRKTGASVKSFIFYNDPTATDKVNVLPAAGANLELRLNDSYAGTNCVFEEKSFTTTVSADGSYEIGSLPEETGFGIYGHPATLSSVNYEGFNDNGETGLVGTMKTLASRNNYGNIANQVAFAITSSPSEWSSYPTKIAADGELKFVFSKSINVAQLNTYDIRVNSGDVAISTTWSTSNDTLVIKALNGSWEVGRTYTIYMPNDQIRSSAANEYLNYSSHNFYFIVSNVDLTTKTVGAISRSGPSPLPSLLDISDIAISWGKVDGATYYQIYTKTNLEAAFTLEVGMNSGSCVDGTCIYGSLYNPFYYEDAGVTTLSVIVIANDGKKISQPSPVLTLNKPSS